MDAQKPTVLILRGVPGCGKTTFAKELQNNEKGKWKRINRDELRMMLDDGYFRKGMDTLLLKVRNAMIDIYLREGLNIILDDTHASPWVLRDVQKYIEDRAVVEVKEFDTPLEECIRRDAVREKPVGEEVIRNIHKKLKSQ